MSIAHLLVLATRLVVGTLQPDASVSVSPAVSQHELGVLVCETLSRPDLRSMGARGPLRKMHIYLCGDTTDGAILGAVLRPNGVEFCSFQGVFDFSTGCATLQGCGLSGTVC